MNKIKITVLTLLVAASVALAASAAPAAALECRTNAQKATSACKVTVGVNSTGTQTGGKSLDATIKTVVNVMLFIIGALSVIMIIVGGIRYVTSTGDSSRIKGAKDTIMYAVIGLIVALFAFAIVNFVVNELG